jgi:hypothetical protein
MLSDAKVVSTGTQSAASTDPVVGLTFCGTLVDGDITVSGKAYMKKILKPADLALTLAAAIAVAIPFSSVAQNHSSQGTSPTAASVTAKANPETKALNASGTPATPPAAQKTVEYKDPEDMTTRYRPGNNKTSTTPAGETLPANGQAGSTAAAADAKKHVSNVKYNDLKTTVPPLDGASKDAAKSKVTSPPTANTSKQAPSATPDTTRKNKVDSFPVKQ